MVEDDLTHESIMPMAGGAQIFFSNQYIHCGIWTPLVDWQI
jgi:hypothetical protein